MNLLIIKARTIARKAGLTKLYWRFSSSDSYEEKFHDAIVAELHTGDLVWDVGANLGLYTKVFAEKTGASGEVVAFEPAPKTYEELSRATAEYPRVRREQMALGDFDGTSSFVLADIHQVSHMQRAAPARRLQPTASMSK